MFQKFALFFEKLFLSGEEKMFFVKHLALMIRAGVALPQAVKILALQTQNRYWKNVLNDVKENLSRGNSFEKSLIKYQNVFGPSFISMVRVGELKGDLSSVLDYYFGLQQKEESIKRKVKSALAYPIIILTTMLLLGIGVVFYIFPRLAIIFQEMELELPLPTRILIGISNVVTNYGFIILGAFILLIILCVFWMRTAQGKKFFQAVCLKLPIVATLIKEQNLARLSGNLSILLKSGVPISEALEATSNVLKNVFYKQSILEARGEIRKGNFVHNAFAKYPNLYSGLIIQIMIVGEEAGVLDEVLAEVSSFYEKKVSAVFESLTTIIEPILILILGFGVAFVALSVLLPIYSLAQI